MSKDFKLDGLETAVALPEEYLTVRQWEDCLRYFVKDGKEEINFQDLAVLRQLTSILVPDVELADLPMTSSNFKTLSNMYTHVGQLIVEGMGVGEEVIQENLTEGAENKTKAPSTTKAGKTPKKRGRPRKNN